MDIVDKLKDRANAPSLAVSELNHDAADEIERLRAWVSVKTQEEARAHDYSVRMHDENERLKEKIIRAKNRIEQLEDWNRIQTATWAASDREVKRLREALAQIASGRLFQHAHEFARAALAEKEEK